MPVFYALLGNTFVAGGSMSLLWLTVTFWAYLETRNVLATGVMGGVFMLLMAVTSVPFGGLVDRHRKKNVMIVAAAWSVICFALAAAVFVMVPAPLLTRLDLPWFWLFITLVLTGCVVETMRAVALSTSVTLLVPGERRANANGLVGMVNGATFLVSGVFSGLAYAALGLGWVLAITLALAALTLLHLFTLRIREPEIVTSGEGREGLSIRVAWAAMRSVPGLVGLVLFTTLNNFLGGTFMALLDPYGLELMSVEAWGILYGVSSIGLIIGGGWIARFGLGARPLRSLLIASLLGWAIAFSFTLRDSVWLLAAGIIAYMCVMPVIEGAEQTVLQRVVPYAQQGRVFGLAQAIEVAAGPVSAFVVAPLAQWWIIPYANSPEGSRTWSWLLGEGSGRGIALVFVITGAAGFAVTVAAFFTATYRRISRAYAAGDVNADVARAAGRHENQSEDGLGAVPDPAVTAEMLAAAGRPEGAAAAGLDPPEESSEGIAGTGPPPPARH